MTRISDLNTDFLESLLGYNTRRASLSILSVVFEGISDFHLSPVEFSILSLIHHNPGVTSRKLSEALAIQPPNLVGKIAEMLKRGWISREADARDKRALALMLTPAGLKIITKAEQRVEELETIAGRHLSHTEKETLIRLLKKVYFSEV